MVSIRVYDRENDVEYGALVYENNENGEVFVHDEFHCVAAEDGFDNIFGTNDEMITIVLDPAVIAKKAAEYIVDHIVTEHHGETYDHELADRCTNDYLSDLHGAIVDQIDQLMMKDYLKEDNLTIKNKEESEKMDIYDDAPAHGCWDCANFDGDICVEMQSGSYGRCPDCAAEDCDYWDGGL